jgi:hypothetical protein
VNSRPYLVITLALTTLVGAGLAWNQYRELVELRAAALNPDERAEWQKRAWDLEARNRELQDQLAALQARPADAGPRPEVAAAEPPPPDGPQRGGPRGGGRGQQFAAVRDLVNKPEVQALMRVQQTAAVDNRYAALFHTLNLDPAQTEKLKALLVERQSTLQDVMAAARDQGINPRNDPEAFRKLIADAQNDINASIRGVVGDNGLAQLQNYEQTLPQRTLVNEIQQRLSYTNTPLTPSQADQLVQILATTSPQRNNNNPVPGGDFPAGPPPGGGRGGFGGMAEVGGLIAGAVGGGPGAFGGGNSARVTAAAVTQAQAVLAPPQVAVLQQVQEQQQSQQKLQQILRETVTGGQNGTGAQPGGQGGGGQGRRKGGG